MYKLLFVVGLGVGAWYFFTHFRVQGWENLRIQPRAGGPAGGSGASVPPANLQGRATIRVVSINFGPLDEQKLAKPTIAGRIAQILRQFDVIALQDIQARDQAVLMRLMELVNAQGRHYDFATAPGVGRDLVQQFSAFVFDAETIQVDRHTVLQVEDRLGLFRHPPLVASFRARGPAENEAFTFSVVNVQTPAERFAQESPVLAAAYRAIRDSGRNEDDILLAGEIGTDDVHLDDLGRLANVACAVSGLPTTTRGSRSVDNILFDRRATTEFTHRSGVMDLVRELGCSSQEAADVSEHLPVWAEFSVYEGGQAGHVAAKP